MKQQKGRVAPPAQIDHQAVLRERLARAAYAAAARQSIFGFGLDWDALEPAEHAAWSAVGMAVLAQLTAPGNQRGQIAVASLISARSGEPMVDLRIAISPLQIAPGKAREIALLLLEAADAAESDAALNEFAKESMGLEDAQAAALIVHLRAQRERRRGKAVESA